MEWVETTGKTLDEAKDEALDQLGVDEQDAEFEILEEPRSGLFGRLRGEARVRARVAPRAHRPKPERRRTKSSGAAKSSSSRTAAVPADAAAGESAPTKAPAKRAASRAGAKSTSTAGATKAAADMAPAPTPPPAAATNPKPAAAGESKATMDDSVTVEEQAEIMEDFLVGLLDAFGTAGEVSWSKVDDDTVEMDVTGDDLGLLIGPKGLTLQAVQDMARTVVQRQAAGHHEGRVRIDIGGYRQRRREALARFATQVAEQVKDSGSAKSLEPMNAADRKIVHDTVNDIEGVATRSDGQDPDRWVVIFPDEG